ncbi:hypothetical protein Bbelb_225630 [Branchiostoma belcheri]|nr:hypothetical protein Bbelb_225630 [Branchiostoma belcheri]
MASTKGSEGSLQSLSPELQTLAQLILKQTQEQQETLLGQFKDVGEKLSNQIRALDNKVEGLSADLTKLRVRVGATEKAAEFQTAEIQDLRSALVEERRERLKADLLAERYSRKADIIIRGLPYSQDENSEQIFAGFLTEKLHLDPVPFAAVHRLSKPTKTRPNPPLLARLLNFNDRDRILREGRKLRGNKDGLAVYEHLPPPLQAARANLVPDREAALEKVKGTDTRVSIWVPPKATYAVLLVNGQEKKRVDAVDLMLSTKKRSLPNT